MQSRIEDLIEEIDDYIANCKPQVLSKENIIVDHYHMDELLGQLKRSASEELKRYQKVMAQKDAILQDAYSKAETIVNKATAQTNEMLSDHEIIQQAYAKAEEIEIMAEQRAQEIINAAVMEANDMRMAAVQYTDQLLEGIEGLLEHSIQTTTSQYENMVTSLHQYYDVIVSNRQELRQDDEPQEEAYEDVQETDQTDVMQ